MWWIRPFVLVAGMLPAFSGHLPAQEAAHDLVKTRRPPRKTAERAGSAQCAINASSRREAFCRAGEANVAEAVALRLKQTSKDFAEAIARLGKAARLFHAGQWTSREAETHLQIGEIYFVSSKYKEAMAAYDRALALGGSDPDLRARALSHMARTEAFIGHSDQAENYSKLALGLNDKVSSKRTQAEVQEARGETLFWNSDARGSIEFLARADDLYGEARDDDGRALALLMMAFAVDRGDRPKALQLARQALQLWHEIGNDYGEAQVRALLAHLSVTAGHYETALCNCALALKTFQKAGDRDNAATVLNTMGYLNLQTGDPQNALANYLQAQASFAAAGDQLGEPLATAGRGAALTALKRYPQVVSLYEASLLSAQKARNPELIASAQEKLGGVYELQRQYEKAESLYGLALDGYRKVPNPLGEGAVLIRMALIDREKREYPEAIALLQQARQLKEKSSQVEYLAQIDYELASIYLRLGRLEEAHQAIQRTIDIIDSQRLKMSNFDSRASYFASVHNYYSLYIELLMLLNVRNPQGKFAVKAFEASERSKVRSLLDWLAGSNQNAPCKELLKQQEETADAVPALPETSRPLKADQIQAEIAGDDAVLLEYALGDEKSYLWVVSGEQTSWHELPSGSRLNQLVLDYRRATTALQPTAASNDAYLARVRRAKKDFERSGAALYEQLLGPVALGGVKRVIIVPDGPLQYVPFAALSAPGEKSRQNLGAHHEVIILPSMSALKALRAAVALRPAPTLAAAVFADPVFEPNDKGGAPQAYQGQAAESSRARSVWRDVQGTSQIPRLPGSHDEAAAVQKLGNASEIFVAERYLASRYTVLHHDLGRYRIIHFATHGVLDSEHPEQSGLILSLFDSKGQPRNGYLTLNDIYHLKLSADLVVLSSCDSGLGKDLSSEGIIGLPRAFLRAGAKSVIATLWKVDDRATAQLMRYFYTHLQQGESPASALRNSQMELSQKQRWSNPYYWAAFELQGDYR
jgi:CHAT domain-containing protein/tetratricopeptide (TPR) repeat protein